MKSIERRFKKIAAKNPYLSSYICFARAIAGQGFSHKMVQAWFVRLVDKQDYDRADKLELVNQLSFLANKAEDGRN